MEVRDAVFAPVDSDFPVCFTIDRYHSLIASAIVALSPKSKPLKIELFAQLARILGRDRIQIVPNRRKRTSQFVVFSELSVRSVAPNRAWDVWRMVWGR